MTVLDGQLRLLKMLFVLQYVLKKCIDKDAGLLVKKHVYAFCSTDVRLHKEMEKEELSMASHVCHLSIFVVERVEFLIF